MAKKTRRQLFGQHFLHEKRILQKIIEAIQPEKDDLVVEIGPGKGALTFPLAARAGQVVAVEKDFSLVQTLEKNKPDNLEIIAGDILQVDLTTLIKSKKGQVRSVKLAGNLPYHISSQILFVLLRVKNHIDRAVFLFQKEVAERIVAGPGSRKYAPLSILLQNYFDCNLLFLIKPGAFSPPPEVDSACVSFSRRTEPRFFPEIEEGNFFEFLKACFRQRRKTLLRNLEGSGFNKDQIAAALQKLHLETKVRAEELEPEKLLAIYHLLKSTGL
ncbi:MAG: ribosomal RNA small subunit methyltransferase A [Candidatus Aminicenantes bacterium]|nr:ribosomal RNA small subunit methyltransferase A [Candidatus Aminicenantes bacterium]